MRPAGVVHKRGWLLAVVSLLVIISFLLSPPLTVLDKTHAVGYAICHQFPDHTFHNNGVPLPLCARCTGIYLGFLSGLVGMALLRRQHAIDLPPTGILAVLVMFIAAMVFDGINSFLGSIPGLPQLYPSQNWLRLATGTLHGLAISVIAYPVVSISIWRAGLTENVAIIETGREFAAFVAVAGGIILLVLLENPLLLYPLAVLSTLGVILMLTLLNTVLVLVVTRCEAAARSWRDVLLPATMALAISFLLIGGVGWLRDSVTTAANLPF
jgi:uncharacterized membrane protein